jgi:hypothetical protein
MQCPICIDDVKLPFVLPCQHLFCKQCLISCRQNQCPICRRRFDIEILRDESLVQRDIASIIENNTIRSDSVFDESGSESLSIEENENYNNNQYSQPNPQIDYNLPPSSYIQNFDLRNFDPNTLVNNRENLHLQDIDSISERSLFLDQDHLNYFKQLAKQKIYKYYVTLKNFATFMCYIFAKINLFLRISGVGLLVYSVLYSINCSLTMQLFLTISLFSHFMPFDKKFHNYSQILLLGIYCLVLANNFGNIISSTIS